MNQFLHNVQIRTRLLFIVGLLLIGVTILTATSLVSLRSSMVDERSAKIVGIMDGAMGIVSHFHQLQVEGKLTEEQAKQQALEVLTQIRYEKTNYIFGYDKNFIRILHPAQPDTIGKNYKDAHDADNVYFIQLMVDQSVKNGNAFVFYRYAKPGQSGDVPKLAYVAYNADWGWILGTGVYLDDLNKQFLSSASVDIAIGVILLVVISLLTLMISRGILAQLGGEPVYAVEVVTQVSQGNLTIKANLHPNDRTSLLAKLQLMVHELRKLLIEVRSASESIQSSATEIAQGNMDLSGRTENQSASLEETASSMNELTATVRKNSESARKASELANTASDVAVHGGSVVKTVVDTMDSIKQSSSKIVDIISVIDGIAFQTNILALNAAVEAARAGEQGRGFAVVASEVRTLAQRSASAAKEIKELIQDSVNKVQAGASQVDDAGKAMNEIVESIKHVTQIMTEIAQASVEQTQGIEQVNSAIVEMDGVTQQNAALVEEAAAAAQSMQDQSGSLVKNVNTFRLD